MKTLNLKKKIVEIIRQNPLETRADDYPTLEARADKIISLLEESPENKPPKCILCWDKGYSTELVVDNNSPSGTSVLQHYCSCKKGQRMSRETKKRVLSILEGKSPEKSKPEEWEEELAEYGELHNEDCCVNTENGCDWGIGNVDCCWNMKTISAFIRSLLSQEREKVGDEIDNLIASEMIIADMENEPTSRLTSLAVRITAFLKK